jgi:hypothetical protein
MTIAAFEAQASWLPTVTGMRCTAVEADESLLSIYFATAAASDSTDDNQDELHYERAIHLDGAWRIELGDAVLTASEDPDDERNEFLEDFEGRTLDRFEVSRPGYDLALFLSDGLVVRCFPIDSLEYADEVDDPEDAEVSWWVDGEGIPDEWESARET